MKLTWYGHSCFRLESPSGSVIFDPYADGFPRGLRLPDGLTADLVLCSHEHEDHNARERVALTGRVPALSVERIPCWHDDAEGRKRGPNTIHIVVMDGLRVAHLGDLGCPLTDAQLRALGKPDALMLPVGGFFTIGPEDASRLADASGARVVIPMHYRGEGWGLPEIGTADAFLALRRDAELLPGNTFELTPGGGKKTVVFRLAR